MSSGDKDTPKREVLISPLRYLISGCARGAELNAMAPLNLSNKWARILRMSSAPKIQIDDFLQVKLLVGVMSLILIRGDDASFYLIHLILQQFLETFSCERFSQKDILLGGQKTRLD